MENNKHMLLVELLTLTKEQQEALKEENIEKFQELMGNKQNIMNTIDALHKASPKLKEQKEEQILNKIIELDSENRIEFDRQYKEAKQKLREVRQMKKRDNFYSNPYGAHVEEGIFFDKKNR